MFRSVIKIAVCLAICFGLAGCALGTGVMSTSTGRQAAVKIALSSSLQAVQFSTTDFELTGWRRGQGEVLAVYIEGDGLAWRRRHVPSPDPTPRTPVSLRLAAADPAAAVCYIARPCQFVTGEARRGCDVALWTHARYGRRVLAAMHQAVDQAKALAGADTLELIGHSGGGTIAALLAAKRKDVRLLVTVAGNLDHALWTAHHGVSPLKTSLNPVAMAGSLLHIPQVHLVGEEDEIVPPRIGRRYMQALAEAGGCSNCRLELSAEAGHHCCWSESWAERITAIRQSVRKEK